MRSSAAHALGWLLLTMDADLAGSLALAVYAAGGAALVAGRARRCPHGVVIWLLYGLNQVYVGLFFRWRSNRRCPFPNDGPAIVVSNHRSPADPLLLWKNVWLSGPPWQVRSINYMMAAEHFHFPVVHWFFQRGRAIPVERRGRDMAAARETLRRLEAGELVGIFPEGRINTGPGLLKANTGVAWLALKSRVPVYPVFIHNAPQGRSLVHSFFVRTRVRVTYGEPVDLSPWYDRGTDREVLHEVTDVLMGRIAALGGLEQGAGSHN